jgi:hypothetical protein
MRLSGVGAITHTTVYEAWAKDYRFVRDDIRSVPPSPLLSLPVLCLDLTFAVALSLRLLPIKPRLRGSRGNGSARRVQERRGGTQLTRLDDGDDVT